LHRAFTFRLNAEQLIGLGYRPEARRRRCDQ
jgi:hypothetical protein